MSDVPFRDLDENLAELPTAFLECRNWGHAWRATSVTRDDGSGSFEQGLICTRCTAQRAYVLDREGWFVKRQPYTYPPGYVFPKGTGRVNRFGRANIRTALVDRYTLNTSRRNGKRS